MFKTITGRTRLKAGAVPFQFQWTKACNERSKNKLQNLKEINEMQAQEERRQSIVDSFCQDVELKQVTEQVTAKEASNGVDPMEEMNAELENENIQPTELSAEEQIKILKAKIKDLEEEVGDLKRSGFEAENNSKDPELLSFYTDFVSKKRFDSFYSWVEAYAKTMIKCSQIQRQRSK